MVSPLLQAAGVAQSLGSAIVASSTAPLLMLDQDLNVLAVSASFCRSFGVKADQVEGHPLSEVCGGAWNRPQLAILLKATARGQADIASYELDFQPSGTGKRSLVLDAQKLDYGDPDNVRLLLSIADVTDARLAARQKDELVREKAVLVQELHHRVANSLQIIASVLLQSARRVQSDETRGHLNAAHHRVMSVASLQRQLASSSTDDVSLRTYLTELCASIGASMIRDRMQISLDVSADDSVATSDVSVSLGLIVTELVINALKHAFPNERPGKIKVGYQSENSDWTLSVVDDGVGMPKAGVEAKAGLGTSIVQALASQLRADVTVADASPGTAVEIVHSATVQAGRPLQTAA